MTWRCRNAPLPGRMLGGVVQCGDRLRWVVGTFEPNRESQSVGEGYPTASQNSLRA